MTARLRGAPVPAPRRPACAARRFLIGQPRNSVRDPIRAVGDLLPPPPPQWKARAGESGGERAPRFNGAGLQRSARRDVTHIASRTQTRRFISGECCHGDSSKVESEVFLQAIPSASRRERVISEPGLITPDWLASRIRTRCRCVGLVPRCNCFTWAGWIHRRVLIVLAVKRDRRVSCLRGARVGITAALTDVRGDGRAKLLVRFSSRVRPNRVLRRARNMHACAARLTAAICM